MRPNIALRLLLAVAPLLAGCGAHAGALPECVTAADCPVAADECSPAACLTWTCHYEQVAAGTRVGAQVDCVNRYCDAAGVVQVAVDPTTCQPEISDPLPRAPAEPDGPVTLHGKHLTGATVSVGWQSPDATSSADGTSVTFTPPPHSPAGLVPLQVSTPFGTFIHPTGFEYSLRRTRPLAADGDLGDWSPAYQVDSNVTPTDWLPADRIGLLYAAYDTAGLWIGLDGGTATSPANGLVIYIDPQPSLSGSSAVDLSTLTDNGSPLSDACSSSLRIDQYSGFQPRACAGTVGMASVTAGQGAPATGAAGLRWLSPASHFDWRLGPGGVSQVTVATAGAPEAVELFIPWSALGLAPYPPDESSILLALRIVSPDGQSISNQYLPYTADPPNVAGAEAVFVLW